MESCINICKHFFVNRAPTITTIYRANVVSSSKESTIHQLYLTILYNKFPKQCYISSIHCFMCSMIAMFPA